MEGENGDATPALRPRRRRRPRVALALIGTAVVAVLGGATLWVAQNPQPIIDRVTVWQYEPPPAVEAHVTRLALTDHGRFLYYASQPTIASGDEFTQRCPIGDVQQGIGILGCYVHADKRITVFDVTDERLDGAEEVVAAHEMLHAAWDRMGDGERDRLTRLLDTEYERLAGDPAFVQRMEFYADHQPGQRANELHSIIGTEVPEVSEELEEYYARYFTDRAIVTQLHAASHAVFVQLEEQADALVARMTILREGVEADYENYLWGYETLNADIETFNARAASGFFTTQEAFNRSRSALVSRRESLDALYASITERVAEYDALARELESINETSVELQRGLNIGGAVESEAETPAP